MPEAIGHYRPAPPRGDQRIDWPADFGLRFTLFVDTEEEFDWSRPFDRANRSTRHMRVLPQAHRTFTDVGLAPIYMVDHPIASDARAIDILGCFVADGTAAIGTQLHPWVNPPFVEPVCEANSFAGNLPPELEAAKLDALGEAIQRAFGKPPIAYRAGRYGLGPQTLAVLESRGYLLDTSMRSLYDYSGAGGPDYSHLDVGPFWCGPRSTLIELPLSSAYTGMLRGHAAAVSRLPGANLYARAGLLSRVALTPEDMPLADALEAIRVMVGDGVRLLSFSYHSPSIEPGHTPYVRDAGDLATFYRWWDAVFALLARMGAKPATLDEIVAAAWATR